MILSLFVVLVAIALALVAFGLFVPTHSEQSLIGFALLFVLALQILGGGLQYESGSYINSTYTYSGSEVSKTDQTVTYFYSTFNDSTSHTIGWAGAVGSVAGFIGILISLRGGYKA